jgi:hypothetical protein
MAPVLTEEVLTDAERSHCSALSVDLIDVSQSSRQGIRCYLVSELVTEVGSLLTSAAYLSASVGCM